MIPKQLITQLNSGRCFALIGSGPSTAMGYPGWRTLGRLAAELLNTHSVSDVTKELAAELRRDDRLPELFDVIADACGGIDKVVAHLKPALKRQRPTGAAYEYLAKWPIRCYLTTNYDNEIHEHLRRLNVNYATLNNSQQDFAQIGAYTNERIVKLHGDFDYLTGLVLGDRHYQEFKTEGRRQYFREKLKSLFSMVPVLVVGHSMSDPDVALILEFARELNSFDRPIYMIVADATYADSRMYQEHYNIHLLSYENSNGTHSQLIRLLRQINCFVIPRTECVYTPLDFPDPKECAIAASLCLFSKLGLATGGGQLFQRAVTPQVLATVAAKPTSVFATEELRDALMPPNIRELPQADSTVEDSVTDLSASKMLARKGGGVQVTPAGVDAFSQLTRNREVLESQVSGLLTQRLNESGAGTELEIQSLTDRFRATLFAVFRQRGLAASSTLFHHAGFNQADMPELFETIMGAATQVKNESLRLVFSEFVMELLTSPTETQREYLASLAQGFFAYHMFGADPSGTEARKILAQDTVWICDSNILLPLIADGSNLYSFANDMISRLRALNITLITTSAFITETFNSYRWAARRCISASHGDILVIVWDPNYNDNLFIEGYINGAVQGLWNTYDQYVSHLKIDTPEALANRLASLGIVCHDLADLAVSSPSLEQEITDQILNTRLEQGTLRGGELQATAETEALQIIRGLRKGDLQLGGRKYRNAYFLSTSRLLDVMYSAQDGLITWFPENLYRHLNFLTSDSITAEGSFDALTTNYYAVGVDIVSAQTYRKFFSPEITEARMILEHEKGRYEAAVAADVRGKQAGITELLKKFDDVSDLDKPRFAAQVGWYVARHEAHQRLAAEERANRATVQLVEARRTSKHELDELRTELDRREIERKRHLAGRERNLRDPKHLKKRDRQARKRKKNR